MIDGGGELPYLKYFRGVHAYVADSSGGDDKSQLYNLGVFSTTVI